MNTPHTENVKLGAFNVCLVLDDDGHLSVYVNSKDGSSLVALDEEIGGDAEFGQRFTTRKIESDSAG